MLRQRRDQPEDTISESLHIIVREADRLDEMTASLLDISRVRVGRVPLKRERVNLDAALKHVMAELAVPDSAVETPEQPVVVSADGRRVSQLLRAIGAFLGAREGAGALSARLACDEAHASVVMGDDGDPLAPERADRLFSSLIEPALDSPSGWRIGLPELFVARGVAEAHGGSLSVESPADSASRGVRFTLTLPLERA